MSFRCERCPAVGRCGRCRKRNAKGEARRSSRSRALDIIAKATEGVAPEDDAWLISPDDGVIDQVAISVAVRGERRVRLTHSERVAAATAALRHRSTVKGLCVRLALPYVVSEDLTCRTPLPPPPQSSERNSAVYVA